MKIKKHNSLTKMILKLNGCVGNIYDGGYTGTNDNSFNLDMESVQKVISPLKTKEIMVYGYIHTHYQSINNALCANEYILYDSFISENSPIKSIHLSYSSTSSNEKKLIKRRCKNALISVLFENFKRSYIPKYQKKEIIPIVFCLDTNDPISWNKSFNVCDVFQKNELITHSELRFLYKICTELSQSDDILLRNFSMVTRQSLKEVRVDLINNTYYLIPMNRHIWEDSEWNGAYISRYGDEHKNKKHNWVNSLNDALISMIR